MPEVAEALEAPGRTTQTGIPITDCGDCGKTHPVTRRHCSGCGTATVFLDDNLVCIRATRFRPFR